MKKVLLSSVAALAVFSAVAPVFADINGGANTPGAYDQPVTGGGVGDAYNSQTEFVTAQRVNEYIAAHSEDINANKAELDAAKAALATAENAPENFAHNREELLKPYRDAVATAQSKYDAEVARVRNEAIQSLQKKWNTAKKEEGNYYILNETPEQKNARYLKEHGLSNQDATKPADQDATKPEPGKPGATDQAKKADAAAKKAGVDAKAGQKALPKTHAAK
ncbi:Choline binding protein A [Streptococcus infantis]|uniref:Choline binding protein A n=1 Tax=Streptococcus infantis TaxID=68892 RepID=A0A139RCS7_9STRE|nr:amylase-binding adhesin AbpA [Streptococcus infantis]KXU12528.1 Choline binding protein A [Streptococcus infantis]